MPGCIGIGCIGIPIGLIIPGYIIGIGLTIPGYIGIIGLIGIPGIGAGIAPGTVKVVIVDITIGCPICLALMACIYMACWFLIIYCY